MFVSLRCFGFRFSDCWITSGIWDWGIIAKYCRMSVGLLLGFRVVFVAFLVFGDCYSGQKSFMTSGLDVRDKRLILT